MVGKFQHKKRIYEANIISDKGDKYVYDISDVTKRIQIHLFQMTEKKNTPDYQIYREARKTIDGMFRV